MKQEAIRYMVVPDLPGTNDELLKVIDLGFKKKKQTLTNIDDARRDLVDNSQGSKNKLRNIVENLHLSEAERKSVLDVLIQFSEVNKLINLKIPQIAEEEPWKSNFTEEVSDEDKNRMLSSPLKGMLSFGKRNEISVPVNITERIFVVNEDIFNYVLMYVAAIDHELDPIFIAGVTLANRLCVINNDRLLKLVEEGEGDYESLFKATCVHELWHSLSYKEKWLPQMNNPSNQLLEGENTRRAGLFTSKLVDLSHKTRLKSEQSYNTLHKLAEGFIEYMTIESLKEIGEKEISHYAYVEETEFVINLIRDIGLLPFIDATFSKKGFATLMRALKHKYEEKYRSRLTYTDMLDLIGRELVVFK